MPVGVAIIDRNKIVRQVNSAALAMMGYDCEDQILGKQCHETLCPSHKNKCPLLDLGEDVDNAERVLLTRDRREVPILKTVKPVRLNGEELLCETFMDISDRKRAEEALEKRIVALTRPLEIRRTFFSKSCSISTISSVSRTSLPGPPA